MSKAEERVVKFTFNNTGFERKAEQTLQTLERLEGKLQFKDAEKGFKNVEKAAQNVKMSGFVEAISTVETKFSAMQIAGITAISNIVNKAVDAGERLVKSLSIDQVTEGYSKYEEKVTSVKTIMSATGKSIEQVNKSLKRLNWFTDETSYNYSDMANNIGKFTSAGVDLDDAVIAMQGIATWAGISGQNTQSAARAMYNISQAMGAGAMKLIDWKSIENANMATTEFKQTAIDTAVAMGMLQKDANGLVTTLDGKLTVSAKDFTGSLQKGWFTSDVMLETLRQYGSYAEEVYNEVERSGRSTIDVMKELGEGNDSLGKRAFEASQQSRTMTDAINATKDAVSTQWMNIIESVIGNAEQATEVWSEFGEVLYTIFAEPMGNNAEMIEEAFLSNWDVLTQKLAGAGISVEKFSSDVEVMARAQGHDIDSLIEEYGSLEDAIRNGGFEDIIPKIFMGYYQNALNSRNGVIDMTNAVEKYKTAVKDLIAANARGEAAEMYEKLAKAGYDLDLIDKLAAKEMQGLTITVDDFSDSIFTNLQFTDDEIKALQDLAIEANTAGSELNDAINNLDEIGTRELFIDSFRNALESLQMVLDTVKEAWNELFPAWSVQSIRDVVIKIHDLSDKLRPTARQLENIKSVAKGVFAIFDIGKQIITSLVQNGFNVLSKILAHFGIDIGTAAGSLGEMIYQFDMWLKDGNKINTFITGAINGIGNFITNVKTLIDSFMQLPKVKKVVTAIKDAFSGFGSIFKDFITNLKNIDEFTFENFMSEVKNLGNNLINFTFGIDENAKGSLSKIGETIKNGFLGIIGFLTGGVNKLSEVWSNFWPAFKDTIKNINPLSVLLISTGMTVLLFSNIITKTMNNLLKTLRPITQSLKAFIDMGTNVLRELKEGLEAFFKTLAFKQTAAAVLELAAAIALLAGAIWVLSQVETDNMWAAAGVLAVLTVAVIAMAIVIRKNKALLKQISSVFIAMSVSVAMLAASMILLNDVGLPQFIGGLVLLAALFGAVIGLSRLAGRFSLKLANGAVFIIAFATAIGILALSMRALNKVDSDAILDKAGALSLLVIVMSAMAAIAGKFTGIGTLFSGVGLLGFVLALRLLISQFNKLAEFDYSLILDHIKSIIVVFGMLTVLAWIAGKAGTILGGAAALIFSITISVIVLVEVIRGIADIPVNKLIKGTTTISILMFVMGLVVSLSEFAGEHAVKAGGMILMMAVAVGGLALVIWGLGLLDTATVIKGTAAVVALLGMFSLILFTSKFAARAYKTVYAFTVMIGSLLLAIGLFVQFVPEIDSAIKVAVMLDILFAGIAGAFAIIGKSNAWKKGDLTKVLSMIAVAGAVGALVIAASAIPGARMDLAITAFAGSALLLAEVAAISKLLKGNLYITDKKLLQLAVLEGIALVMAAAINGISALFKDNDPKLVLANFAGVILSLLAVAEAMNILKGATKLNAGVIPQMLIMAVIAGAIGAVLATITGISQSKGVSDPASVISLAVGMSVLILAIGGAVAIASKIQMASIGNAIGICFAAAGFAVAAGILMAFMNALPKEEIPQLVEEMIAIGSFLLIISAVVGILAALKIDAGAIISAGAGIAVAFGIIGLIIAGLGYIVDLFNQMAEIQGIDIVNGMTIIGEAIGALIGGVIGGFGVGLSAGLPMIGTMLSEFVKNAQDFFDVMSNIDPEIFGNLGELFLGLGAIQLESLISVFTGGMSWAVLSEGLEEFGGAIVKFEASLEELPGNGQEVVKKGIAVATELVEFLEKSPRFGGLVQGIIGNLSWTKLGEGLEEFGTAMKSFADTSMDYTEDTVKQVKLACQAGEALCLLLEDVPGMDGLFQKIFGEQSWSKVTDGLGGDKGFGAALASFAKYSLEIGPREELIAASARAAKMLIEVLQSINWENNKKGKYKYETISEGLPEFGFKMKQFVEQIKDLSDDSVTKAELVAGIAKTLSEALSLASNSKKGYNKLTDDLIKFVKKLAKAAEEIKDMDDKPFLKMKSGVEAILDISGLKDNSWEKSIDKLGKAILKYSERVAEAHENLKGINIDRIKDAIDLDSSKVEVHGNDDYEDGVVSDPERAKRIREIEETLWEDSVDQASESGKSSVEGYADGILDSMDLAIYAAKSLSNIVIDTVNDEFEINSPSRVMMRAGEYVVAGLLKGLYSGESDVTDASIDMAYNLLYSFRDFLGIHSPAEEFYEAIKWCVEGIKKGASEGAKRIKEAGKTWGTALIDSVGIEDIAKVINGDFSDLTALVNENLFNAGFSISDLSGLMGDFGDSINNIDLSTLTAGLTAFSEGAQELQDVVLDSAKKDYDKLLEMYEASAITRAQFDAEYKKLVNKYSDWQSAEYKKQMDIYNAELRVTSENIEYYKSIVNSATTAEDKKSEAYKTATEELKNQQNQYKEIEKEMKKYQGTAAKNNIILGINQYAVEENSKTLGEKIEKANSEYEDAVKDISSKRENMQESWAKDSYEDIFKFTTNKDVYDKRIKEWQKDIDDLNWEIDKYKNKNKNGVYDKEIELREKKIEELQKKKDSYEAWYKHEAFDDNEIVGIEFDFDKIEKSTAEAKKFEEDMMTLQKKGIVSQDYIDYIMSQDFETAKKIMDWSLHTATKEELSRASTDITDNKKAYESLGLKTWEDALIEANDKWHTAIQNAIDTVPDHAKSAVKITFEDMNNTFSEEVEKTLKEWGYSGYSLITSFKEGMGFPVGVDTNPIAIEAGTATADSIAEGLRSRKQLLYDSAKEAGETVGDAIGESMKNSMDSRLSASEMIEEFIRQYVREGKLISQSELIPQFIAEGMTSSEAARKYNEIKKEWLTNSAYDRYRVDGGTASMYLNDSRFQYKPVITASMSKSEAMAMSHAEEQRQRQGQQTTQFQDENSGKVYNITQNVNCPTYPTQYDINKYSKEMVSVAGRL